MEHKTYLNFLAATARDIENLGRLVIAIEKKQQHRICLIIDAVGFRKTIRLDYKKQDGFFI